MTKRKKSGSTRHGRLIVVVQTCRKKVHSRTHETLKLAKSGSRISSYIRIHPPGPMYKEVLEIRITDPGSLNRPASRLWPFLPSLPDAVIVTELRQREE